MSVGFKSSKLGTQEYWNTFYKREIQNFSDNKDDTGECWFDDSDAEAKMIQYVVQQIEEGHLPCKLSFLDLGTGNGHLLFSLSEELEEEIVDEDADFSFHGVDYSPDSVEFATSIAQEKYLEIGFKFDQVDLLDPQSGFLDTHKFDVLLDKGTLDAIALNHDPLANFDNKIGMDVYAQQVVRMMHENSVLLITSCNFTLDELKTIICANGDLEAFDHIHFPTFEFGGHKGSTICSIAFRKVEDHV